MNTYDPVKEVQYKLIENLNAVLEQDPMFATKLLGLVSQHMASYQAKCMEQATSTADSAINTLANYVRWKDVENADFHIDAVLHECRHMKNSGFSGGTRCMIQAFRKEVMKGKPDEYLEFVQRTRGLKARQVIAWALYEYKENGKE